MEIAELKAEVEKYREGLKAKAGKPIVFAESGPAGMVLIDALVKALDAQENRLATLEARLAKPTIEFIDGPRAGQVLRGDEAHGLYWVTHWGTVGKRSQGMTAEQQASIGKSLTDEQRKALFAGGATIYEVAERQYDEHGIGVVVRMKHVAK